MDTEEIEAAEIPITERFQIALDQLVVKLRADTYVLGVILLGSMSHDVIWEKSDIDLLVITQEVKHRQTSLSLTEEGVNIHAYMVTRTEFRRQIEGSLRSSFMHSMLSKGTLIYTRDETLRELFDDRFEFGVLDRQIQALRYAVISLPALYKAEKWLRVKQDLNYSALYILFCANSIAGVETVLHGEITGREVVQQAIKYNPELFKVIYSDVLHGGSTEQTLEFAIEQIRTYLLERVPTVFQPILDYLAESASVRSATEINDHFHKHMQIDCIETACEWLADENIIRKVSAPVRVTEKSRVCVEESAYYYDSDSD